MAGHRHDAADTSARWHSPLRNSDSASAAEADNESRPPGDGHVAAGEDTPAPRRSTTEPDRSVGHVRFSEELPRSRSRTRGQGRTAEPPVPPQLGNTNLYTINSNVDEGEARRGRSRTIDEAARPENLTIAESPARIAESPVSLGRSRKRFAGVGDVKDAAMTAVETSTAMAHYRDWVARYREKQKRWKNRPSSRLKVKVRSLYKKYIIEGLLRQRPLPPSEDGRHIPLIPGAVRHSPLVDSRTKRPHISNSIRSSRYTMWDFLPRQLFFQFSKLANFYFLCIGIMQMVPGLSTTGTYTTIGPLIVFVALSMAKEGYDDYKRYTLDKQENQSPAWVLDPMRTAPTRVRPGRRRTGLAGKFKRWTEKEGDATELEDGVGNQNARVEEWSQVRWEDIRVGDVIRLRRDDNAPADILLLYATGPNGIAYIETMALDGETNLKSKQACPLLAKHCTSIEGVKSCNASIVSEDPNLDLYNFDGRATVNGETLPLTMSEVIYRGSTLRNTSEAFGLVLNTGEECKIRMNAHKHVHAKAPAMQSIANKIVVLLVVFVVLLSVGCTIGNEVWKDSYAGDAWYLEGGQVPFKEILIGFIIAFNTLIPLSLYVSLEIIKLGQLYLLQDVEMYDEKSNTPMVANTTTILENLGQVDYVFSDKTGTLTENLMRFRKMTVAGTAWLHDMDVAKDEAEKELRRKLQLEERRRQKGKATQASQPVAGPAGRPSADTQRRTQWRSTVRPDHAQPDYKTEDLLEYLRVKPNTTFARKARQFILCIALCHTCLPETKADGTINFQAASPDELALVEAARDLGYLLIDRPAQTIKLRYQDSDGSTKEETYGVLDVIEFSSKRKRMSIVIRMPDGRICIFCKGADSVILPRLKLNHLALQKATAVEHRASMRKSVEQEKALRRRSMHGTERKSMNLIRAASSMAQRRSLAKAPSFRKSMSDNPITSPMTDEVDTWLRRREEEELQSPIGNHDAYGTPRTSLARQPSTSSLSINEFFDELVDDTLAVNEGAVFERCFQHIEDFASEGLRTLVFSYRYLEEDEYTRWKKIYHSATTSLVSRQERIEAAAELIENDFDLAGATAIEDKLQEGVPETIDKLRRANIKVWMLTGDKRETAINIAHSARICKPYSEVYILDETEGDLQQQIASTLVDVGRGMIPHYVVVIDGHTLGVVEADESLKFLFFDLVARVDSVICCRASPSQKASLVKCIRHRVPKSLTLAIGDGANDIAMIQASHVGIGISGREGLQAARISDFSIAQFRFLQRLLFVHGRWNYIRTAKYILGTFWKEIVFYIVQAQYQRYNGYTGTSLFEPASLTVFNTLFTSLPVILLGIFEKDLHANTLLAMPELYTYGQLNQAFNFRKYLAWNVMAAAESILIYHLIYAIYSHALFDDDTTIYAMGDLAFTVCVIFINVKMLVLEMHTQTIITLLGLLVSIGGWFSWNVILASMYPLRFGPYIVRTAFFENFGQNPTWWLACIATLAVVIGLELVVSAIRRVFWPKDQDLMQEVERYAGIKAVMKDHAAAEHDAISTGRPKGMSEGLTSARTSVSALSAADTPGEWGNSRRSVRRMDSDYSPPPFTPPAEEGIPLDKKGTGRTGMTNMLDVPIWTRRSIGDPMRRSADGSFSARSSFQRQNTNFELRLPERVRSNAGGCR